MEETGWKLVHGDVFRPPQYPMLLVACIGSGLQLLCMVLVIIGMLLLGVPFVAHNVSKRKLWQVDGQFAKVFYPSFLFCLDFLMYKYVCTVVKIVFLWCHFHTAYRTILLALLILQKAADSNDINVVLKYSNKTYSRLIAIILGFTTNWYSKPKIFLALSCQSLLLIVLPLV